MGKRSNFERRERDFYPTPKEAVGPLIRVQDPTLFVEPCAGDGALVKHLEDAGFKCREAFDIEPKHSKINKADAFSLNIPEVMFITNPPWDRKILHPLIEHLSDQGPTWLLFDADWIHTQQSRPYLQRLRKIVSVGRLKWIPESTMTGKDNCAWYLFDHPSTDSKIEFIGRV